MSAEGLIAGQLRMALEDLNAARVLGQHQNRFAWFHCQQSIEKVILALLTSEGKHGGIRHKLDDMVDLIPDENPLKPALRELEFLSVYATSWRYPTPEGKIKEPRGDLGGTLAKIGAVLEECARRFGVDLKRQDAPATRATPIR